jgi:ComF family protein
MSSRWTGAITMLGREAARMVLPSPCVVCADELPWFDRRASCCNRCWGALRRMDDARCRFCALPWTGAGAGPFTCIPCGAAPPPLEWTEAWGHYAGGMEKILHAFKFLGHDFLAPHLARLAIEALQSRDVRFDAVVPVPMHPAKQRKRGYNQAALLSRSIARNRGLRHDTELLRKKRDNATQSTLPREERRRNVRGVFEGAPGCRDLDILLVDDISTTGETLRSAAGALKAAGARSVAAIVIARA